ncbi:MAG: hypothetical protein OEX81_00435 [Candidatus Pacebacteria bacterium]|nr:hypothetical protein [Candidatus Paceibacterota bacterium]
MNETSINPDLEHDLFSDEVKVGLERVGDTNALALVMENIPLQPELTKFLYGENDEGIKPTLDYVNVATDDIVKKAERGESHLDDLMNSGDKRAFFRDNNAQKQAFQIEMAKAVDIDLYSEQISEQDSEAFNQLKEILQKDPGKPLLIISGHGNAGSTFEIGEHAGDNYAKADRVIENYVSKKDYAAVVLIACKPNEDSIIEDHGLPLFFVNGFGGIGNEKKFELNE